MKHEIKSEIERIYQEHGSLTPALLVAEASSELSPLHPCFEWDDAAAGEKHRLWQARMLIRSVRVSYAASANTQATSVRAYFSTGRDEQNQRYVGREVLVQDISLYEQALSLAIEKLNGAEAMVAELRDMARSQGKDSEVARIAVAIEALGTAKLALTH